MLQQVDALRAVVQAGEGSEFLAAMFMEDLGILHADLLQRLDAIRREARAHHRHALDAAFCQRLDRGIGEILRTWAYQTIHPACTPWASAGGGLIAVRTWLYKSFFASWAEPRFASLLWALAYVCLWLILMTPLYRRRIYIKV